MLNKKHIRKYIFISIVLFKTLIYIFLKAKNVRKMCLTFCVFVWRSIRIRFKPFLETNTFFKSARTGNFPNFFIRELIAINYPCFKIIMLFLFNFYFFYFFKVQSKRIFGDSICQVQLFPCVYKSEWKNVYTFVLTLPDHKYLQKFYILITSIIRKVKA